MSRDPRLLLEDIRDAARRVAAYASGQSYESFKADSMRSDAVVRNLEVMGEAARRLPRRIRSRMPEIPWSLMCGMRNVLAHEYFRVDLRAVWETAVRDLPPVLAAVEARLSAPEAGDS